jgi:hypothetical protein
VRAAPAGAPHRVAAEDGAAQAAQAAHALVGAAVGAREGWWEGGGRWRSLGREERGVVEGARGGGRTGEGWRRWRLGRVCWAVAIMLGYAMLCDAVLCCAVLCCAVLCCAVLCDAMLCYAMRCDAMPCYAMLCYAMLCYAMLCYAMLCYAMPCHAMLCYAMLCYAMLCLLGRPSGLAPRALHPPIAAPVCAVGGLSMVRRRSADRRNRPCPAFVLRRREAASTGRSIASAERVGGLRGERGVLTAAAAAAAAAG